MKIAVLGAGAWGTALACHAALRHEVMLWAREPAQARSMRDRRENARYLAGVRLPAGLLIEHDVGRAAAHAREGLAVIAAPMSGLRPLLRALPAQVPVLWLCKGFEAGSGALGHEIAREERATASSDAAQAPSGVLSGPSFAIEVARGCPTALVAASAQASLCQLAVDAFHAHSVRVYTSTDPVGVEVGGAVKNVLAIATGILDGLAAQAAATPGAADGAPGLNARAALITRGLAEMSRLGVALGARADTFMGLSGLGDLVLTATGSLSRNRQVGLLLAEGRTLDDAVASLGHVAEGVYSAATVLARARAAQVDMPITQAVVDVLQGRLAPRAAVAQLMSRDARPEG
jgi:glycerol-3-phosphate dehydrogenase (NAD(P)+)